MSGGGGGDGAKAQIGGALAPGNPSPIPGKTPDFRDLLSSLLYSGGILGGQLPGGVVGSPQQFPLGISPSQASWLFDRFSNGPVAPPPPNIGPASIMAQQLAQASAPPAGFAPPAGIAPGASPIFGNNPRTRRALGNSMQGFF